MRLGDEYFGDGAMRQLNPLSPAIHLGADRLLIIGVRARQSAGVSVTRTQPMMPSPGEIFGYMRIRCLPIRSTVTWSSWKKINELVKLAPQAAVGSRHVETLMLAPSVDPREIASRHGAELPEACARCCASLAGAMLQDFSLRAT